MTGLGYCLRRQSGDVTFAKVMAVPGFGQTRTKALIAWRAGLERRFRFNPTHAVDPRDIAAVDQRHAARRNDLERILWASEATEDSELGDASADGADCRRFQKSGGFCNLDHATRPSSTSSARRAAAQTASRYHSSAYGLTRMHSMAAPMFQGIGRQGGSFSCTVPLHSLT